MSSVPGAMHYQHLLVFGYFICICGGSNQLDQIYDSYPTKSSLPDPQFVYSHSQNVTAILHKAAHLNCRVKGVFNRTVAWIRHKDRHILTVGRYIYTSDQRFRAIHQVLSEDYLLQISYVKATDGGLYECQISTTCHESLCVPRDPRTSILGGSSVLEVTDPRTSILGGSDIYFAEGDTMNITCLVRDSPEPTQFIFWYHLDKSISYSSPRGSISQITGKGDTTASFLLVQKARIADSGLYSCKPSIGNMASVNVHVIRSEDPAHWITNSALSNGISFQALGIIISFIMVTRK